MTVAVETATDSPIVLLLPHWSIRGPIVSLSIDYTDAPVVDITISYFPSTYYGDSIVGRSQSVAYQDYWVIRRVVFQLQPYAFPNMLMRP